MKNTIFILFFLNLEILFLKEATASENKFECFSESAVSGLFQNKKKFLKDSDFFGVNTILNLTRNFEILTESDNKSNNNRAKELETKYKYSCKRENNSYIISCTPSGLEAYSGHEIKFSTKTLRFRKSLITDYWLKGKGSEVDYVHIAHGYCYNID